MKRLFLKIGCVFGIMVVLAGAVLGAVIKLTQNPLFIKSPISAALIILVVLLTGIGAVACGKQLSKKKG